MSRLKYGVPCTYGSFDLQEFHEFVIAYAKQYRYPVKTITVCPRIYNYLTMSMTADKWIQGGGQIEFRDFGSGPWITILKGEKEFSFHD